MSTFGSKFNLKLSQLHCNSQGKFVRFSPFIWQLRLLFRFNILHRKHMKNVQNVILFKQQYVTWPQKQNVTMHAFELHKTASLVKPGHTSWRKCPMTALSFCHLLFSTAFPNNYAPVWDNSCLSSCSFTISFLPSASSVQYLHFCHEVGCYVQLHRPLTWLWFRCPYWCWTSICRQAKPPLIAVQTSTLPSVAPLQLQSAAGSLHVAFRNHRESQSLGRAVVGHQRENHGTVSP